MAIRCAFDREPKRIVNLMLLPQTGHDIGWPLAGPRVQGHILGT